MRDRIHSLVLLGACLVAGTGLSVAERALAPEGVDEDGPGAFARSAGAVAVWTADWSWLQAYVAWERREAGAMRDWLRVVGLVQPESEYFLHNAARMLAFDVPAWRGAAEPDAPDAVRAAWRRAAGLEAIAWLAPERRERVSTWVEAGNIALHAVQDIEMAAAHYGRAARLGGAPWHVGRIHVRLLLAAGKPVEARAFLRGWVPQLPRDKPEAQRTEMDALLGELERALGPEGF